MISPTEVCGLISDTEPAVCLLWCSVRRNDFVWQASHSGYPVFLHEDKNKISLTNFMLMFIFVFYIWLSSVPRTLFDCVWNVMAHAQKPHFVFRRNGRVHLKRRGCQFGRLLATEVCSSAVVMLDTPSSEVVWRVLATHSIRQFSLHFPSRASLCAITFQLDST